MKAKLMSPRYQESQRRWRENNVKKLRANARAWNKANRERRRFQEYRKSSGYDPRCITLEQWNALCALYGYRCLRCGESGRKLTLDHIIPVSAGGKWHVENIQPLCQQCNLRNKVDRRDYRANFQAINQSGEFDQLVSGRQERLF